MVKYGNEYSDMHYRDMGEVTAEEASEIALELEKQKNQRFFP